MLTQSSNNLAYPIEIEQKNKYFAILDNHNVVLDIYVQPGSRISVIAGLHGELLKIKVGAPPLDGKANEAVIDALSLWLGINTSSINIVRGERSRLKRVLINSIDDSMLIKLEEIYCVG